MTDVTRAADEPQYAAPLSDRLGYLQRMLDDLDNASPDSLHGAAHIVPLAGIEFPMLPLLAEANDAAIEAGTAADLDELARLQQLTRSRLVAEAERIADGAAVSDERGHDEIVAELRARGEVMTAEVLLLGAPARLGSVAAARLRAIPDAQLSQRQSELIRLAVGQLVSGDPRAASVELRSLVEEFGLRPLSPAR